MTSRGRLATCVVGAIALAIPAVGAKGQDQVIGLFGGPAGSVRVSLTDVPVRITGQFTVSFHGDAATGCATAGLCGYSGTIVVRPRDGSLSVRTFRRRRRLLRLANLAFDAGSAPYVSVARVERAGGGVCADGQTSEGAGTPTAPLHRANLTIRFLDAESSVLSTRCAGPLDRDVMAAGPAATIPMHQVLRGRTTLELSGTRSFAAAGFAGTVASTIVLHLAKPLTQLVPSGGGFPSGTTTRRIRIVSQSLTVVHVAGRLSASVRGTDDPAVCRLLDSCGLAGTVDLTPGLGRVVGYLTASGSPSRPYEDFLAALGLSRMGRSRGIRAAASAAWLGAGVFRVAVGQGGTCTGSAPLGEVFLEMEGGGGRLSGPAVFGPWRTRCPGPMLGSQNAWLTGTASLRTHGTFTIHLRPVRRLEDDGYAISLHGGLTLTLRRGRVKQSLIREPED